MTFPTPFHNCPWLQNTYFCPPLEWQKLCDEGPGQQPVQFLSHTWIPSTASDLSASPLLLLKVTYVTKVQRSKICPLKVSIDQGILNKIDEISKITFLIGHLSLAWHSKFSGGPTYIRFWTCTKKEGTPPPWNASPKQTEILNLISPFPASDFFQ